MNWKEFNPRSVVAVLLAFTVCSVLLLTAITALLYPPGTVTETFRQKIFEILIYIIGIVSGWLLGKGTPEKPPDKPPNETKP